MHETDIIEKKGSLLLLFGTATDDLIYYGKNAEKYLSLEMTMTHLYIEISDDIPY